MRHVQKEGLVFFDRPGDGILGLQSDRFGEEGVGLMIFLQSRNRPSFSFWVEVAIAVFSKIATGGTKGTAGNIDIESQFGGILSLMANRCEMSLSGKNGMITI